MDNKSTYLKIEGISYLDNLELRKELLQAAAVHESQFHTVEDAGDVRGSKYGEPSLFPLIIDIAHSLKEILPLVLPTLALWISRRRNVRSAREEPSIEVKDGNKTIKIKYEKEDYGKLINPSGGKQDIYR
jgi:hypothetical protein